MGLTESSCGTGALSKFNNEEREVTLNASPSIQQLDNFNSDIIRLFQQENGPTHTSKHVSD